MQKKRSVPAYLPFFFPWNSSLPRAGIDLPLRLWRCGAKTGGHLSKCGYGPSWARAVGVRSAISGLVPYIRAGDIIAELDGDAVGIEGVDRMDESWSITSETPDPAASSRSFSFHSSSSFSTRRPHVECEGTADRPAVLFLLDGHDARPLEERHHINGPKLEEVLPLARPVPAPPRAAFSRRSLQKRTVPSMFPVASAR